MTLVKLNNPQTYAFRLTIHLISSFAVLCFASLALSRSVLAQNMQPRPVARLISDTSNEVGYSRSRRVKNEESSPPTAVNVEPNTRNSTTIDNATPIERRAFEQTNRARVENGLASLEWDSQLCRMARIHSEKMSQRGFFSHETPDGLQLKER